MQYTHLKSNIDYIVVQFVLYCKTLSCDDVNNEEEVVDARSLWGLDLFYLLNVQK